MAKTTTPVKQPVHAPSFIGENIKFTLTIPWAIVQKGYQKALQAFIAAVEIKGFRKGKAPAKLVEEKVGKTKIYEETVSLVLSPAYTEIIQKKNLKPMTEPHIHPISMDENKDWEFEIEIAEYPEVKLGNYLDIVKTAKVKNTIWTPGKDEKKADNPGEKTEDQQLRAIFHTLLEKITVRVPELLIRKEVNHSLSRLLQQLDRLHVTLDDYLKSVQKTADQLRQDFALNGLTTLQIEFILTEIAKDQKLEVSEKEIDDVIRSIPDETARKANQTPRQRALIASTLLRQKTVEWLLKA